MSPSSLEESLRATYFLIKEVNAIETKIHTAVMQVGTQNLDRPFVFGILL
jgi:hypothetical protein